jgi:hypothetical protein
MSSNSLVSTCSIKALYVLHLQLADKYLLLLADPLHNVEVRAQPYFLLTHTQRMGQLLSGSYK